VGLQWAGYSLLKVAPGGDLGTGRHWEDITASDNIVASILSCPQVVFVAGSGTPGIIMMKRHAAISLSLHVTSNSHHSAQQMPLFPASLVLFPQFVRLTIETRLIL
jgi:hypothetical protein